jgi:hypothetical protein
MDPKIAEACDNGLAFVRHYAATATAQIMQAIIQPVVELGGNDPERKTA